jgi:hypothetical protein
MYDGLDRPLQIDTDRRLKMKSLFAYRYDQAALTRGFINQRGKPVSTDIYRVGLIRPFKQYVIQHGSRQTIQQALLNE